MNRARDRAIRAPAVIFGAGGDLTKRKLIPALYNLRCHGLLPRDFAIVGVGRQERTHEAFREQISKDIREFATVPIDDAIWKECRDRLYFSSLEFDDPAGYTRLASQIQEVDRTHAPAATCCSTSRRRRPSSRS